MDGRPINVEKRHGLDRQGSRMMEDDVQMQENRFVAQMRKANETTVAFLTCVTRADIRSRYESPEHHKQQ